VTNVQIAIEDRVYAEELRRLLVADGKHRVHVVHRPTPFIQGVVVLDATLVGSLTLPEGCSLSRFVVFNQKETVAANAIWEAGIRHVIHAEPPPVGRLVVLAAEMRLNAGVAEWEKSDVSEEPVDPGGPLGTKVELWEQIRDLRNALANAVWNSCEVAEAMGVLHRSGREVQLEIDAVLLNGESSGHDGETAEEHDADFDGVSMFDATDRLFLQALKIRDR